MTVLRLATEWLASCHACRARLGLHPSRQDARDAVRRHLGTAHERPVPPVAPRAQPPRRPMPRRALGIDVACDDCGASPGEGCRGPKGTPSTESHKSRRNAWRRQPPAVMPKRPLQPHPRTLRGLRPW